MTKQSTNSEAATDSPAEISAGAARKRRLGRGLSSLIGQPVPVEAPAALGATSRASRPAAATAPGTESSPVNVSDDRIPDESEIHGLSTEPGPRLRNVEIDTVVPNPHQPRRVFEESALAELAASIRSAGVMQPILVRPAGAGAGGGGGEGYELIAGERRWRAAARAGLERLPAIIVEATDEQSAEWALVENVQREELGPMERARAFEALATKFRLTHAQIAERVGLDRSSVTNLVRLTELEEPIQAMLEAKTLTLGHGKALLAAAPGKSRIALAQRAARENWSVRRAEQEASRSGSSEPPTDGSAGAAEPKLTETQKNKLAALNDLERQLGEHLGTKVAIRTAGSGTKGRVSIEFFDLDHFEGLMERMGFTMRS